MSRSGGKASFSTDQMTLLVAAGAAVAVELAVDMKGLGRGTGGGETLESFIPPSTSETLVLRTDRSMYLVAASATALLIFGAIPRRQVAARSAATKHPSILGNDFAITTFA